MPSTTPETTEGGQFRGGFRFGGMDVGDPQINTSMSKAAGVAAAPKEKIKPKTGSKKKLGS